jgi:RNA polymerase sigma factor (sigma-70 family)
MLMRSLACIPGTPRSCCVFSRGGRCSPRWRWIWSRSAFAQAFADRERFRGGGDREALAWLFGIARHLLGKYYRRGVVEHRAVSRLGVELVAFTDADYERVEELAGLQSQRVALAEGLAELSVEHRDALRMRIVEERSYAELASTLGISEQTARARVSRALRMLTKVIERVEGSPDHA